MGARHCSTNFANRHSNQMTKMIFHLPAGSRILGPFSSRPKRLMKLSFIYASTARGLTSTPSNVSVSSSWSQDHLRTDSDCHDDHVHLWFGNPCESVAPASVATEGNKPCIEVHHKLPNTRNEAAEYNGMKLPLNRVEPASVKSNVAACANTRTHRDRYWLCFA